MEKVIKTRKIAESNAVKDALIGAKITGIDFMDSRDPESVLMEVIKNGKKQYVEFGADNADVTEKTIEEVMENPFFMKLEGPDIKTLENMTVREKKKLLEKYVHKSMDFMLASDELRRIESSFGVSFFADAYQFYGKCYQMIAYAIIIMLKNGEDEKNEK